MDPPFYNGSGTTGVILDNVKGMDMDICASPGGSPTIRAYDSSGTRVGKCQEITSAEVRACPFLETLLLEWYHYRHENEC